MYLPTIVFDKGLISKTLQPIQQATSKWSKIENHISFMHKYI